MKKITLLVAFFFGIIATGSAQFLEDFEAGTTIPAGWSVINQGGTNEWEIGSPLGFPAQAAHSGTNVARISYNFDAAHDDYLITPQITPTAGVNDRISFWVSNYTSGFFSEHYEVLLSTTDASSSANFSVILQPDTAAPADVWGKMNIDLTPYNGVPIYIAFRAVSQNQYYLFFDDIANDTAPFSPPSCDAVLSTPLNGATAASTNGVLSWSGANGDPTGYNLTVGTSPGDSDVLATTDVGNVTSYSVGALLSATTYYVSIVPYNSNGVASGCTENSFTTFTPPANDDIAAATELILDLGTVCGANQLTLQSISNTTASPEVTPSCAFITTGVSGDVWYKIVAPSPTFTLTTSNITGPNFFTASGELYSGAPGGLTAVGTCGNSWPKNYTGLTVGDTYYLRIWDFNNDGTGTFSLCGYYLDCVNATATYAIVSDCVNAPQFYVDVNVTSLGSATSLTVTDNQASPAQNVLASGVINFGPYPNGTPVTFSIANDQNAVCTITSPIQNQAVCPPDCATSPIITACGDVTTTTLIAGVGAWNVATCGFSTQGTEAMYSFTPTISGVYSLEVTAAIGGYVDYFYKAASGTCETTGWTCIGDAFATEIDPMGTLTAGVEYWILLDSEGTTARTHSFKINCPPTCTNATATYAIVSDCLTAPQFYVDINVTSLGSATSLTVSDNQSSPTQNVSATGIVTFGPFPNATPVIFTIANDQDVTCILTSPAQNQVACPGPNDVCSGAIDLIVGTDFNSGKIVTNNLAATTSPELPFPTSATAPNNCGGFNFATTAKDIWYTVTVPASGNFKVETKNGVGITDTAVQIYSGNCASFVAVTCDDDSGTGNFSLATVTGRTPGEILYVRVFGYVGASGTFDLSAYDASLATSSFDTNGFYSYPNPVTDILNLSYSKNIDKVQVMNLLGQEVQTKFINATNARVDMSALASGTYLVKVTSDNQVKTLKVVKN